MLSMMNIKIILLLGLAAYASCGNIIEKVIKLNSANVSSSTNPDRPEALADRKEKTDAEIIEESFKDCIKWITKITGWNASPTTMGHCQLFTAKNIEDFKVALTYFDECPDKKDEPLSLELFTEIFEYHRKKQNLSVQECALAWKEEFVKISNTSQIIRDSFNDCRQLALHRYSNKENGDIDNVTYFWFCQYMSVDVGNDKAENNFDLASDYVQNHLNDVRSQREDFIDFKIFSDLFRHHCGKLRLTIEKCAKQRKDATKVKIQERIEGKAKNAERWDELTRNIEMGEMDETDETDESDLDTLI